MRKDREFDEGTVVMVFRVSPKFRKRLRLFCAGREIAMGTFCVEAVEAAMRRAVKGKAREEAEGA